MDGHTYKLDLPGQAIATSTNDRKDRTMTLALCFWILMLIWLVWGVYTSWPNLGAGGGNLLLFLLLLILGWAQFGAPIK